MSFILIVGFYFFIIVYFFLFVICDISIMLYVLLNMDVFFDLLVNSFGFELEMGFDFVFNYSVILFQLFYLLFLIVIMWFIWVWGVFDVVGYSVSEYYFLDIGIICFVLCRLYFLLVFCIYVFYL